MKISLIIQKNIVLIILVFGIHLITSRILYLKKFLNLMFNRKRFNIINCEDSILRDRQYEFLTKKDEISSI